MTRHWCRYACARNVFEKAFFKFRQIDAPDFDEKRFFYPLVDLGKLVYYDSTFDKLKNLRKNDFKEKNKYDLKLHYTLQQRVDQVENFEK